MEYKLYYCESCTNIISVKNNNDLVYICPLCGLINKRSDNIFSGHLTIKSEKLYCEVKMEEDGELFNLLDIDDELLSAIEIMAKHGWNIKFKGAKDNK